MRDFSKDFEVRGVTHARLRGLLLKAELMSLGRGRSLEWFDLHVQVWSGFRPIRPALAEGTPVPCLRCLVIAPVSAGAFEHFPVDVLEDEFQALPTLALDDCEELVREYMQYRRVDPAPGW